MTQRMPALYLSHGAPPLADDPSGPANWPRGPRPAPPKAILMVSAHWEEAPLALGATETVPLVYDFWGFPEHYYQVTLRGPRRPGTRRPTYASCCAPPASRCRTSRTAGSTTARTSRWSRCSPTPTSRCSRSPCRRSTRTSCTDIGRKLAPLRDEGVLIVGSGFFTHNLAALRPDGGVPSWSAEFDDWGQQALARGDVDALLDFEHKAPAGRWPTRAPSTSPRCS